MSGEHLATFPLFHVGLTGGNVMVLVSPRSSVSIMSLPYRIVKELSLPHRYVSQAIRLAMESL